MMPTLIANSFLEDLALVLSVAAVTTIMAAGASAASGVPKSNVRFSASILPQSGTPGPTPSPRNESAESDTRLKAKFKKELATTSGRTLG